MAWAFVNAVGNSGNTGAAFYDSTAGNHTTGNALIVCVSNYSSPLRSVTSVTDTAGNSYAPCGTVYNADSSASMEVWVATNITGNASNVVRANFSGSANFQTIQVLQYSGLATSGVFDAMSTGKIAASATTQTTNAVTTTAANDLVLGFYVDWDGTGPTPSGSGGSILRLAVAGSGALTAEVTATTPTAYTVSVGLNFGNRYECFAFAFKTAAGTTEQEGARFYNDDAGETSMTAAASQDADLSSATAVNKIVRLLVNGTGDPASLAYTLRSQKNGSGGYTAVPVGATTVFGIPTWQSSATPASNTTAVTWPLPSSFAAGDLLIWVMESANEGSPTAPTGSTAVSASPQGTGTAAGTTATKLWVYAKIATGSETTNSAGDMGDHTLVSSFAIRGVHQTLATALHVVAGDVASTGSTSVTYPGGTTTLNNCLIINIGSNATDSATAQSSGQANANLGSVTERLDFGTASGNGGGITVITGTLATAGAIGNTTATLATSSVQARITLAIAPPATIDNPVFISTSSNITAGGEATTARLTAPSGKSTSDFVTGRIWDDENGTDSIDITTDDYTEVAWSVQLNATGNSNGDYFEFRAYAGTTALDTYTVTPKWTISAGVDINPDTMALALAVFDPVVGAGKSVIPDTGAVALAGFDPLVIITIIPDTAAIALAGNDPAIAAGVNIAPDTMALALAAANNPAVGAGVSVLPDTGAIALGVSDPVVTSGASIIPDTGSIALSAANNPTIAAGVNVVPDTGGIALGVADPTVGAGASVAPDTMGIALNSFNPDITVAGGDVTPDTFALSFTGGDPAISTGVNILVEMISIALGMFDPTVGSTVVIQPNTMQIALQGYDPEVTDGSANTANVFPDTALIHLSGNSPFVITSTTDNNDPYPDEFTVVEFEEGICVVEIQYQGLNAARLAALQAEFDALEAEIGSDLSGVNGQLGTLTTAINSLSSLTQALGQDLADEASTRLVADNLLGGEFSTTTDEIYDAITGQTNLFGAAILAEAAARNAAIASANAIIITDVAALALTVSGLATSMGVAQASIIEVQEALVTETAARSAQYSSILADFGDTNAAVLEESVARADADSALAVAISSISVSVGNKTYRQPTAPSSGMNDGDVWYDSDDNNKPYRYNGSTWVATDDTRIGTVTAAVVTEASARITADGVIEAKYAVKVDANGHIAGFGLISQANNDTSFSAFVVNADEFKIFNGTTSEVPFRVSGGVVYIKEANIETLNLGKLTSGTFNATMNVGTGKIVFDNGAVMLVQGVGFGSSNQFVQWFGPHFASLTSCTELNALFYMKTNGDSYFGGSLTAGTLTTKAQTSSLSVVAEAETSVFGSNGGTITVTLSYTYNEILSTTGSPGSSSTPQSSVIDLYRSLAGGGYALVATLTAGGTYIIADSGIGFVAYNSSASGSLTYTDPTNSTQTRQYKAVKRSTPTVAVVGGSSPPPSQNISIICVEP